VRHRQAWSVPRQLTIDLLKVDGHDRNAWR